MAKKVTLKDHTTDETIYPQTLVDSVQNEDGAVLSTLVLLKDNTMSFTPTADYQPATKKYVDDNGGGTNIVMQSTQPTDQKAGDFWYMVI